MSSLLPLYIFHQLLRPIHALFDRVIDPIVRRATGGVESGGGGQRKAGVDEGLPWPEADPVVVPEAADVEGAIREVTADVAVLVVGAEVVEHALVEELQRGARVAPR